MRSASRNICSTSWETSKMVVPCRRRLVMSPSTWAVSVTPRDAVGSSRTSSCGCQLIARATASSWRCPRERVRTPREGSSSGIPRVRRMPVAVARCRVSESRNQRRSRPSRMFAAMSRLSQSARSCQTTATPRRSTAAGSAGTGRPARSISPAAGAMSPEMQRTSVVLPAPFSPASPTSSPGRRHRLTWSSARSGPNRAASPWMDSSGRGPVGTGGATLAAIAALWRFQCRPARGVTCGLGQYPADGRCGHPGGRAGARPPAVRHRARRRGQHRARGAGRAGRPGALHRG